MDQRPATAIPIKRCEVRHQHKKTKRGGAQSKPSAIISKITSPLYYSFTTSPVPKAVVAFKAMKKLLKGASVNIVFSNRDI
ncbi:hypothetical protein F2P81_003296 [Scophthalmus maximus]|uniref:Uncharacterized protein n=1 Tax=Scophthalmus maximus TaxID=52904 RepID=A0A6A4TI29_SCOMX|nr:hypothetical protein F2P81_003296 [Scophthalmus maximus]